LFEEDEYSEITVSEIVEPVSGSGIVLRGASVELIALLESGDLDYAFEYESVIRQHNLERIDLPDEVNLGSENLADDYARVVVKLNFQRFASLKPVFRGEQIGYGITIPESARHPDAAIRFIQFLFSEKGRSILSADYQPLITPPLCEGEENMPPVLRGFCAAEIAP
jgi:molybdate/tungstate transport system substrate-binding protein